MSGWDRRSFLLAVVALAPACMIPTGWDQRDALAASKVEVTVSTNGRWMEVEYHIEPRDVPAPVRAAMDRLHPGGPYTAAEKEWHGGILYYELAREVNGMEVEAMFFPTGVLHSEELEIPRDRVPQVVQDTAEDAIDAGIPNQWEEIRGADRRLVEYHVKIASAGKQYKVTIHPDGPLIQIYREVPVEIEVPELN